MIIDTPYGQEEVEERQPVDILEKVELALDAIADAIDEINHKQIQEMREETRSRYERMLTDIEVMIDKFKYDYKDEYRIY